MFITKNIFKYFFNHYRSTLNLQRLFSTIRDTANVNNKGKVAPASDERERKTAKPRNTRNDGGKIFSQNAVTVIHKYKKPF